MQGMGGMWQGTGIMTGVRGRGRSDGRGPQGFLGMHCNSGDKWRMWGIGLYGAREVGAAPAGRKTSAAELFYLSHTRRVAAAATGSNGGGGKGTSLKNERVMWPGCTGGVGSTWIVLHWGVSLFPHALVGMAWYLVVLAVLGNQAAWGDLGAGCSLMLWNRT